MPSTGWWRRASTMVVVNLHYKAEQLRDHLAKRRDVEIRLFRRNEKLLGTGGGVVKALPHFEGEPFFMLNSDSIWVEGSCSAAARHAAQPGTPEPHGRPVAAGRR